MPAVVAPRVDVIVLAYNQLADTLACLASLSHLTYPNHRLLVVDNGSTDGTAEAVLARFPQVRLLRLERNLGFQGGANHGLQTSFAEGTDYVFLVSNDTTAQADIVDQLMQHAEAADVGLLAPKIYYFNDPERIWSVGGDRHPLTLEMTRKGDNQLDRGQWSRVVARDFLVGCAVLIKQPLVNSIGPFDTGFYPAYYEDVDLCMRARRAGFRLLLVPEAKLWHKVARSHGGQGSPQERYLMARNSVRYFRKYVRGARWIIVAPYRLASALKTTLRLLRARRLDSIRAYWRGLRDGWRLPTTTVHTLP